MYGEGDAVRIMRGVPPPASTSLERLGGWSGIEATQVAKREAEEAKREAEEAAHAAHAATLTVGTAVTWTWIVPEGEPFHGVFAGTIPEVDPTWPVVPDGMLVVRSAAGKLCPMSLARLRVQSA